VKKTIVISLLIGAVMVSAAGATKILTPTVKMADLQDKLNLATAIPEQFDEWKVDTSIIPLQVDPDVQAKLDKIYNQTLSRTYVNTRGERIMLSIAYGGDQSDNIGVHKPAVCYGAQGFEVTKNIGTTLATYFGTLPVRRLRAVNGSRIEPITYWITIGKSIVASQGSQRLALLRYGLSGTVADGMLVRVSSIDSNDEAAYTLQQRFVNSMLHAISEKARIRLIGVFSA